MRYLNLKKDRGEFESFLKNRSQDFSTVEPDVQKIIDSVRENGDSALIHYTEKFDKIKLKAETFEIGLPELEKAYQSVSDSFKKALEFSKKNITDFYSQTRRFSWEMSFVPGANVGEILIPLDKVGVYIPGGSAPLVSTILMTVLLAKVAGVPQVIAVTPPGKISKEMLAAFYMTGANQLFQIGGPQAIAALAYGTATIPKVDKIVGPGNQYVTAAKKMVYGDVGIDTLAGPSEVLIIADSSATPAFLASDLLSQLEHDTESLALLVSQDPDILTQTQKELEKQIKLLKRQKQLKESVRKGALFIEVSDLEEAIEVANQFAPEHCELAVEDPMEAAEKIRTAGALFLGHYTPVAAGDFVAGPSHVLPTGGAGRFSSGLSLDDFIKKTSLIFFSQEALLKSKDALNVFTRIEGLDAHEKSVNIRFDSKRKKNEKKKSSS